MKKVFHKVSSWQTRDSELKVQTTQSPRYTKDPRYVHTRGMLPLLPKTGPLLLLFFLPPVRIKHF